MINVGNIKNWLEKEKASSQKRYDKVYSDPDTATRQQKEEAFWWSGKIDTCERLLNFIEANND